MEGNASSSAGEGSSDSDDSSSSRSPREKPGLGPREASLASTAEAHSPSTDLQFAQLLLAAPSSASTHLAAQRSELEESLLPPSTRRQRRSPSPRPSVPGDPPTWGILLFLLICMIISSASFSLLAPILPEEAPTRGVSGLKLGSIFSADQLVCVVFCPLFGALLQAERLRSMTLLLAGMVINGLANIAFGLVVPATQSPSSFVGCAIVLRAVCGLGAAAINTAAISLAIAAADASSLASSVGTAIGMLESSETLGEALGPVLGSFLYVKSSFGATFVIFGLVNCVLGPLTWWVLFCPCDPAGDAALPPDLEAGQLLPGPTCLQSDKDAAARAGTDFSAPPVALPPQEESIWSSITRVMTNPAAAVILLASCAGSASFTFLDATLAGHLSKNWGLEPTAIGWCFGLLTVAYTVTCPLDGYVSARIGPVHSLSLGLVLLFVGFTALGPSPLLAPFLAPLTRDKDAYSGLGLALVSLLLLGFGLSLSFVPALPALIRAVDVHALKARAETSIRSVSSLTLEDYEAKDYDDEDEEEEEGEGLEDLLAGLLNSLYFLGGAIGAPTGAAVAEAVGFERAFEGLALFLIGAAAVLELTTWTVDRAAASRLPAARRSPSFGSTAASESYLPPLPTSDLLLSERRKAAKAAGLRVTVERQGGEGSAHGASPNGASSQLYRLASAPPTAGGEGGGDASFSARTFRSDRLSSGVVLPPPPFIPSPRGRGLPVGAGVVFSHGLHVTAGGSAAPKSAAHSLRESLLGNQSSRE